MSKEQQGLVNVTQTGIKCEHCEYVSHYPDDELIFYLGSEQVHITEQNPDWNKVLCYECHEAYEEQLAEERRNLSKSIKTATPQDSNTSLPEPQ